MLMSQPVNVLIVTAGVMMVNLLRDLTREHSTKSFISFLPEWLIAFEKEMSISVNGTMWTFN